MKRQDVEKLCTAVVKTFERMDKVIRLVNSIRSFYPVMPIVVVDDSRTATSHNWDRNTEYHHVDYDVGLSEGRNIAVRRVRTPYTLLLDDDFLFKIDTKIEVFLSILEGSPYELVGGNVINRGGQDLDLFRGVMKIIDKKLIVKYMPNSRVRMEDGYPRFDCVVNFFLAQTELLLKSPWDPDLKTCEHVEFFWRLKKIDARITHTNQVSVHHYPSIEDEEGNKIYHKMRYDRAGHFVRLARQKMGVDSYTYDKSFYYGPFGLFRLCTSWNHWAKNNKGDRISARLANAAFQVLRPFYRFVRMRWIRWFLR